MRWQHLNAEFCLMKGSVFRCRTYKKEAISDCAVFEGMNRHTNGEMYDIESPAPAS